jgi:Glycine-zipper domain
VIKRSAGFLLVAVVPLLGACATVPAGPSVMALPGSGKPFEVFQADDDSCRQWALSQSGAGPNDPVASSAVGGATIGTLLGGALGAAIGAAAGNPGLGAAVGAGSGLVLGTASGANAGAYAGMSMQRRYDTAYTQCMYAKGNQVPTAAQWAPRRAGYAAPPPPPPPPPPANAPAPAPPSAAAPAPPPPPPGPPPPPPPR